MGKNIQDCQTKETEGVDEVRGSSSVRYCHGASTSLVQMPAMGFGDDSLPRQTYKHDRGRGSDQVFEVNSIHLRHNFVMPPSLNVYPVTSIPSKSAAGLSSRKAICDFGTG